MQFFKNTLPEIIPSLLILNKNIARTRTFRRLWNYAVVILVFKKCSKTDFQNYSPISLPNIGSKVLEKIMYDTTFRCFFENFAATANMDGLMKVYPSSFLTSKRRLIVYIIKSFSKKLPQNGLHQSIFDLSYRKPIRNFRRLYL